MTEKCYDCGGAGWKTAIANSAGDTVRFICPTCKGTGIKSPIKSGKKPPFLLKFFNSEFIN
jgi:DnaJ-class molecular chaperone